VAKPAEIRSEPHAFGLLLIVILCSLAFQLAAPDEGWARLVITGFQAGTLVLALWASSARRWELRVGIAVAVIAVAGSTVALLGTGDLSRPIARVTTLVMVALVPPIIAFGLIRSLRQDREITLRTMFGVLCIYLLVGMFFSFMFGLVDDLSSTPFFAQTNHPRPADFLYFSFTTITTTGYGDFTAHSSLGRSLAITEALIGQIYLVTVVALIIGNLGPRRRTSRR
jgi:Ion channel